MSTRQRSVRACTGCALPLDAGLVAAAPDGSKDRTTHPCCDPDPWYRMIFAPPKPPPPKRERKRRR